MEWTKLVDGGSSESSLTHSAAGAAGSTNKRKPGRRGRKPMAVVEATADESRDILADFTWWRGGLISKFIFQKGTLPRRMVKKAARQGVFDTRIFLLCKTSSVFQLSKRKNISFCLTINLVAYIYKCHESSLTAYLLKKKRVH